MINPFFNFISSFDRYFCVISTNTQKMLLWIQVQDSYKSNRQPCFHFVMITSSSVCLMALCICVPVSINLFNLWNCIPADVFRYHNHEVCTFTIINNIYINTQIGGIIVFFNYNPSSAISYTSTHRTVNARIFYLLSSVSNCQY